MAQTTRFDTLDYLQRGNLRQQRAFNVLTANKIFDKLMAFDPVLVGTLPIEIDVDGSDLDVICYWKGKKDFVAVVVDAFSLHSNFSFRECILHGHETVIVNFDLENIPIEIFGTDVPVKDQMGYRHMMIEHRLLTERGIAFREEIIRLKRTGMKTEPAFAVLLGLKGDPYRALLEC